MADISKLNEAAKEDFSLTASLYIPLVISLF